MNPQDPAHFNPRFDPNQNVGDDLAVRRPGETVICVIKRHPIGIIGIYIAATLLLVTIAVLAFGVAPSLAGSSGNGDLATQAGVVIFLVFLVLTTGFAFISNKIYWGNRWIITSDSLTQVAQSSLFNRQSSQLALHNIEDITAEQNGILAHAFKYGLLRAETAGESSKFIFMYCPNPNYYAKLILEAREALEMQSHAQMTPSAPQPQPDPFQQTQVHESPEPNPVSDTSHDFKKNY